MAKATSERSRSTGEVVDGLTGALARYSSGLRFGDIPADVRAVVKHCVLDWLGVTLAGSREDAGRIVREEALEQGGAPQATLIGDGSRISVGQAALVNGTTSHALDYDDVHFAFLGHPTVTVLPAVLALAERGAHSGRQLMTAFVAGVEVGSRVGQYVTEAHYARGHHATGTLGTFAAAAGSARILGLDAEACATALGIAATQAAALKSMFGTMCKPLHAGKAAANGQYAALLAKRGFSSRSDAIECSQGFADTQSPTCETEGVLDGFWELHLAPWDVAAGALVAREAGCTVTDFRGGEDWLFGGQVVAANPGLIVAIRDVLNEADPRDTAGPAYRSKEESREP